MVCLLVAASTILAEKWQESLVWAHGMEDLYLDRH
jgi:hypothetical protein